MQNTFTKYNKDKLKFEVIIDENFVDKYFNLTIANQYESNQWCYNKFINFLFDNIKYSALSAKERNACLNEEFTIVEKSINNSKLILDDKKCGEIGEIALYGVMTKYYGALPVVPKFFINRIKTTTQKVLIVFI
nr:Hachiman antiphage defense system protein HamA [Campylobacter mucosalis]